MNTTHLDQSELWLQLKEQIISLQFNNYGYDSGLEVSSKTIAVILRVLLHQSRTSHSLLLQLGIRDSLDYLDTDPGDIAGNIAPWRGLTMMNFTTNFEANVYVPRFSERMKTPIYKTFFDWWETSSVIDDKNGNRYSRKDLVTYIADKEGAHVDPNILLHHKELKSGTALGNVQYWVNGGTPQSSPAQNPVYPSIRQISYELLSSLYTKYLQVFTHKSF